MTHDAADPRRRAGSRRGAGAAAPDRRTRLLHVYTWLIIVWLVLPIVVMIVFGFNDTAGPLQPDVGRASPSSGTASCSTSPT